MDLAKELGRADDTRGRGASRIYIASAEVFFMFELTAPIDASALLDATGGGPSGVSSVPFRICRRAG